MCFSIVLTIEYCVYTFLIRTSNFAAEAETKVDGFFFFMFEPDTSLTYAESDKKRIA